jgi:hypothetical protein
MKIKLILMAVLFAVLAFTVGCSSEPSEKEMKAALTNNVNQAMQSVGEMGKMFGKLEIHELKKIGCKEATDSTGYYCDYEVDMSIPIQGRVKGPGNALFVKGDKGWMVIDKK